jgi:elongation factor P
MGATGATGNVPGGAECGVLVLCAGCFVRGGGVRGATCLVDVLKFIGLGPGFCPSQDIMSSIQATRMKKGMLIKVGADLFRVLELQHVTPGNLRGFVRVKFRNIRNGALSDQKLRSEDSVERAVLDERAMQYMYRDGDSFHFMDTESYEQLHISEEALGDAVNYIIPDAVINVEFYGAEPVGIELPVTVDLTVEDTAPGIKGATASAQVKPARLETGLVVQVPPFVNPGDKVRVSTETGEYLSRA